MAIRDDPERRRQYARDWYARRGNPDERQIYALLDPARRPRYVGMSVNAQERAHTHWQQRERRATAVADWLRSLDEQPEVWLIQTVTKEQARDAEVYWIKLLAGVPGVDLLNVHRGRRPKPLGTGTRGTANGHARLTDDDVRAIRASTESQTVLAKRYGISQPAISQIKTRKKWTHVE